MPELTDDDRVLLDFEENHPKHDSRKEKLIRNTFGVTAARYYQRLHRLVDDPTTLRTHAQLVHRIQRARTRSARLRAHRSPGF